MHECGSPLALRRETLLCQRGLVGDGLVLVGAQLGHHVYEGQGLHLLMQGLWGRRRTTHS